MPVHWIPDAWDCLCIGFLMSLSAIAGVSTGVVDWKRYFHPAGFVLRQSLRYDSKEQSQYGG